MSVSQATPASPELVTVVVPTYNERDNLPELLARLQGVFSMEGRSFELLIVDDNSPDGTAEVARELERLAPVRCLSRQEERGLSTAVIHGLKESQYDLCVVMDADLSHPPERVPELLKGVEEGSPMVVGSRYVKGAQTRNWPFVRLLNSWVATLLVRPLVSLKDPLSGFFALRRSMIPFDSLNPVGYKIGLEILVKAGIQKVEEVPITFTDRLHGKSKMGLGEQLRYLLHLRRLYSYAFPAFSQFVLFCLVGLVGMIVDLSTVALVKGGLGAWFGWARLAGFLLAVHVNFLLHQRFTFSAQASPPRPSSLPLKRRYLRFLATCATGMLCNWLLSVWLYENITIFKKFYIIAASLGVVTGTFFNFFGSRYFVFK